MRKPPDWIQLTRRPGSPVDPGRRASGYVNLSPLSRSRATVTTLDTEAA